MSLLTRQIFSAEAIDFQGKSLLFKELTAAFEDFMARKDWSLSGLAASGFEKIVQKHTGFNLIPFLDPSVHPNAYIEVPTLSLNHPFAKELQDNIKLVFEFDPTFDLKHAYQTSLQTHGLLSKVMESKIDLAKSRVYGAIEKIDYRIYLTRGLFVGDKFTPAEIAAVVLHEIGHLFTYYEWLLKSATTNCYLDSAWKSFSATSDKVLRLRIVDSTSKALGVKEVDREKLAETNSKEYFFTVYLLPVLKDIRSNLGSSNMDYRITEQVADQFATRHGASRDLVSVLSKLNRSILDTSYMSSTTYFIVSALKAAIIIGISIAVPPVGVSFAIFFLGALAIPELDVIMYDRPGDRAEKILNEVAAALKNRSLSSEERQELNRDYELIKEMRNKIKDREGLFMLIWRNMTSYRRDQHAQLKFQQELERLVNNELFVKASNFTELLKSPNGV